MLSLCLITITVSFTSCAKFKSMVAPKNPFNPVPTEESVSNSPSSASSFTDGKGMIRQETEKYEVTASFLNVRKTASAKAAIVGGLKKGDKVDVYGFKGNWVEIGFKGGKAFVYKEYVEKLDKGEYLAQNKDSVDGLSKKSNSSHGQIDNAGFHKATPKDSRNELRTEFDGFQWYKYYENGYCGAKSLKGEVIIPTNREYDDIRYVPDSAKIKNKWFRVIKNERQGACNYYGREIIAPSKYDKVVYNFDDDDHFEYYCVWLDGREGICDQNGNEVLAPTYEGLLCYFNIGVPSFDGIRCYERGSWEPTGYTFNKSGNLISHHYSNTNESTSNGDGNKELAGFVVGLVGNMLNQIINGVVPQQANDPLYPAYLEYLDDVNKGMLPYISFEDYKVGYYRAAQHDFKIEKSKKPTPPTPSSKDCSYCDHSGKCKTCNGKRWFYPTVGGTGAKIPCPNCTDGNCSHCHGTGKL